MENMNVKYNFIISYSCKTNNKKPLINVLVMDKTYNEIKKYAEEYKEKVNSEILDYTYYTLDVA